MTGEPAVLLVRYRSGVVGETARVVHMVLLPRVAGSGGVVVAVCEVELDAGLIETVHPGHGMPCVRCLLHRPGSR
jgi:hypothetical protein